MGRLRVAAAVLIVSSTLSFGQIASSVLAGEVRDQLGGTVAGTLVTARHEATGFSRQTRSGIEGAYRIEQLLPGAYVVTAEGTGFRTVTATDVILAVDQNGRLDFTLPAGGPEDSITVTASVSPVETDNATAGYHLGYGPISSLPLLGRNVTSLVTLGPGAIPRQLGGFTHDVINDLQPNRGAVALNPPIHGARSTMNQFLLDGASNTDRNTFSVAVNPPLEAVAEFRIQSSLAGAEAPQAGGGVIDVVTKLGSRDWHGNAFEYFRNEATDARNYFDDPTLPRPIFRHHQFGGSLSGPVPLPRSVFFATYEGLRSKSAKSSLALVPDGALRSGDFRAAASIVDPLSTDPATGKRRPFPGNIIPSERIDPIAREFLDTYQPLPNRSGGSSNYLDSTPSQYDHDLVSARLDHELRDQSRLYGRYTLNDERGRTAGVFPLRPTLQQLRAQQAALGHIAARSRWLNEARVSFTRLRVDSLPESAFQTDVAAELGVRGVSDDPFTYGLPYFLVTNFNLRTDDPILPQLQRGNQWHVAEGLSLARGRQTLKLGFQWIGYDLAYRQSRLARGQFIFTGAFTNDPFADFLLGFPQVTNRNTGNTQAYLRQDTYAGYAQYDWRVNSRLTLNAGLRYEYFSPFEEQRDNLLNLDYSALPAPPALVPVKAAVEPDRNNFAPRIGLALSLPHRTAFRAGFGIYYSPEIAVETYDLVRNRVRNETNRTDGSYPLLTLQDGFPQTAATGLPSYFGVDALARTPYVQQWTASIQKEVAAGAVLEVAYIGSKGTKLGRFRTFNTALHVVTGENLPPRPGNLQELRPFPELGPIIQRQHISNSVYHALEVKAEKRFGSRLALLASFAWAKSIDDADSIVPGMFESFGAQDERNLRLERGLSFFDVRKRVSVAAVYHLPWSFELSGILTLQDGTPLNPVYFVYDPANTGTPNRPNVVPGQDVRLPRNERTVERFFNTDAFEDPQPYTFGNSGRNILPGPGNNLLDVALMRSFTLKEGVSLQLRVEVFNVCNHPNFGIPGPYPDFGPFFGRIFATGEPRRFQFGVRFDF